MTPPGSIKKELTSTKEGQFLWNQESAILSTTELICEIMDREGVSRSELADRLSRTRGYITQLLDGRANMTIRTIADVFTALGYEFEPSCRKMPEEEEGSFTLFGSAEVTLGPALNLPN